MAACAAAAATSCASASSAFGPAPAALAWMRTPLALSFSPSGCASIAPCASAISASSAWISSNLAVGPALAFLVSSRSASRRCSATISGLGRSRA